MTSITKILKTVMISGSIVGLAKLSSLLKLSYIMGTWPGVEHVLAYFSFSGAAVPLSGLLAGTPGACTVFGMGLFLRFFTTGFSSIRLLAYHLPGLSASLYWSVDSALFRVGLPILCMIGFIAHPVGWYAAPYALLWLIPITLHFLPQKNLFFHALSSTFIAHGVGSVIWIYTVEMPAESWYMTMLMVPFERVAMATTMVVLYNVICASVSVVKRRVMVKIDDQASRMYNGR